ncbi:MAG: carbon starvation protein A [Opitutae bacterium]|nr:carbon starvation protein A [Opitutae bacterium]
MQVLLIALLAGIGFLVAYHTYGKWLGSKIFALSRDRVCPSRKLEDGVDYVPTDKSVVFGHHFTSIAGTGPIVGPAIAIMWGWLPALLWVIFGSILIGAVHDFGALVVSLRNNGQTVGDIAGRVLNKRVRLLFLLILVMALTIVLAIFGLVIAAVFKQYPAAIFPCIVQIPIALSIGILLHRKGLGLLVPSLIALAVMYLSVIYGNTGFLGDINQSMAAWSIWTWVVVLLVYSYVASVLPVWTLLQPRDYINSLQLISALALIVLGLVVASFVGGTPLEGESERQALKMAAPMMNMNPPGAPIMFPFLFVTIACGAISGFHCLVSSGTSSKQLKSETDARFVGYGGMLLEGFLATLVILACAAGLGLGIKTDGGILTGEAAWLFRYESWSSAKGLGAKVGAFVDGSANFLMALGLPSQVAIALMGVLVASFAGTTLDTACRLQRYVVQELAGTIRPKGGGFNPLGFLENRHGATIAAVVIAAAMAAVPHNGAEWSIANAGKGGLILWPLFGATNQLLAGLAFLVVAFYLWRRSIPVWFIILPMIFMLVMPMWAMIHNLFVAPGWLLSNEPNYLLGGIGLTTIALEIWMIIEAVKAFPQAKGTIEANPLDNWQATEISKKVET